MFPSLERSLLNRPTRRGNESKLRMALEIYEFHFSKNMLKTREMHKLL